MNAQDVVVHDMAKKRKTREIDQSARFIEAARKVEVDESGKKFERAFRKIVPAKKRGKAPL